MNLRRIIPTMNKVVLATACLTLVTSVCAADGSSNAAVAVDLSAAAPSKFDPAPGWPMVSGPYGNFNPRQYGCALVDSLGQARVLWKSDTGVLGMGKMFRKGGGSGNQPPGTSSGVLVAQGLVMGNGYQPRANGRALPFEGRSLKDEARSATGEKLEKLLSLWSVESDDLFVAYDQRTGRTVWQVNEINQGVHRGMGKRGGFHSTPVWLDGRLFGIGTTLRAYAYEAATGRKLWEADLGPAHATEELFKQRLLDARIIWGAGAFASAAVAASPAGSTDRAVVVMPRYQAGSDSGLIGFDPATGAILWEITEGVQSRYAAPTVWSHEGRQYLLTSGMNGPSKVGEVTRSFRMIDPGTGKVLWSETIAPNWKPVITSGKYAFVLVPVTKMTPEDLKKDSGGRARYACYEISPQGAKQVWALPDEFRSSSQNHMDCGPMREVCLRDGLMIWHNNEGHMAVHRLETGEKLFERFASEDKKKPGLHGSFGYLLEDRYFYVADAAHSGLAGGVFFSLKPPTFACLAPTGNVPGADRATTGYEVFLENPYVNGIMYLRTQTEGRINAVDLRKDPPKEAPTPLPLPEWAAKLPEPLRPLASRYRDERGAAVAKLIAAPIAQRPLADLVELAAHQDHLVRQAAVQALAASTAGLGSHAETLRKLTVQALANNDEDGLELFIPIALAVDAPALVKVLEPAIAARLNDPKQSRLALKALEFTGQSGSGMVDTVLPLLASTDERVVRDAAHALARIGGGNTKVVAGFLSLLGPIGPVGRSDSKKLLAVASAMGALRHLAETGGIPADPEKLLPLCSQQGVEAGKRGRFGPGAWGGSGGYWQTRMMVASHQGERAVPLLCAELDAILPTFRANDEAGLVQALTAVARVPAIRERLPKIPSNPYSNENQAAAELLEATK